MNRIGKFLFLAVTLYGALWAFWALRDLYKYWRLDTETIGKVEEVKVQELSASRFDILATYTYMYEGNSYRAFSSLGKPYQFNQFSAQKAAEDLKKTSPTIYFSHRDPEVSALKRVFPLKTLLQAGLTVGIAIYLWVLNLYYAPSNSLRKRR